MRFKPSPDGTEAGCVPARGRHRRRPRRLQGQVPRAPDSAPLPVPRFLRTLGPPSIPDQVGVPAAEDGKRQLRESSNDVPGRREDGQARIRTSLARQWGLLPAVAGSVPRSRSEVSTTRTIADGDTSGTRRSRALTGLPHVAHSCGRAVTPRCAIRPWRRVRPSAGRATNLKRSYRESVGSLHAVRPIVENDRTARTSAGPRPGKAP